MRLDGTIISWHDDRGFGFIRPDGGGPDVFLHAQACKGFKRAPAPGQRVSCVVQPGRDGKPRAAAVTPSGYGALALDAGARARAQERERAARVSAVRRSGRTSLWALPVGLLVVLAGYALGRPPVSPTLLLGGGALLSLVCFGFYAQDKQAARRGQWRVPESTLHLLALAGGWPGAVAAQQILRHKSVKAGFRAVFWATVALNLGGFVGLAWWGARQGGPF